VDVFKINPTKLEGAPIGGLLALVVFAAAFLVLINGLEPEEHPQPPVLPPTQS